MFLAARGYAASNDPRVAVANQVALILAWNTPFYPLYLLGAGGAALWPAAWWTLCSFPCFLAVPALTRRDPFWGRVALALTGLGNTLFCTWLLGEAAGTALFLLPCITLAALLFRREERVALFSLMALPILAGVLLNGRYPVSPFALTDTARVAVLWLNAVSVAVLMAVLGFFSTGLAGEVALVMPVSASVPPPRPSARRSP